MCPAVPRVAVGCFKRRAKEEKLKEILQRNSKAPDFHYDELLYSMKPCVSVRNVNGFPRRLEDKCAGVTTSA